MHGNFIHLGANGAVASCPYTADALGRKWVNGLFFNAIETDSAPSAVLAASVNLIKSVTHNTR